MTDLTLQVAILGAFIGILFITVTVFLGSLVYQQKRLRVATEEEEARELMMKNFRERTRSDRGEMTAGSPRMLRAQVSQPSAPPMSNPTYPSLADLY